MGWTYPTHADQYALGQPSFYATIMFELIQGIEERYEALGVHRGTGYEWHIADGTSKQKPTLHDFDGLQINGGGGFLLNMRGIHSQIQALAPYFTVAPGRGTAYTAATIRDAAGMHNLLPTARDRWNDPMWWQGWQDALDLLIYGWSSSDAAYLDSINFIDPKIGDFTTTGERVSGAQKSVIDEAWQSLVYAPVSTLPIGQFGGGPYLTTPGGRRAAMGGWELQRTLLGAYTARTQKTSITYTPIISGDLIEVWLDLGPIVGSAMSYWGYIGDPLEAKISTAARDFTLIGDDVGDGSSVYVEDFLEQLDPSDFPLGGASTLSIEVLNTLPHLSPIQSTSPGERLGWAAFLGGVTHYVDISGELTDQE